MTVDIEAIARSQRCDASSLRLALPLLEQGYLPPFLARYRRDELGGIGESPLWSLLDAMRTEQRLQERREELLQRCRESEVADEAFQRVIQDARSQRVLDRVARRLRHEPSDPAQQLAARVLSPRRDDPAELAALAEQTVGSEAAEAATSGFDRALTSRINNDPRLMRAAVRWLAKNAKLKILEVSDPHIEENENEKQNPNQNASESSAASAQPAEKQAENKSDQANEVTRSSELAPSTGAKPESGAKETQASGEASQPESAQPSAAEPPPAESQSPPSQAQSDSQQGGAAPDAAPATPEGASASQSAPAENAAPATTASQTGDSQSPASSDTPSAPPAAETQPVPPADATKTDLPESAGGSTPAPGPTPSSATDASASGDASGEQPTGDKAAKGGKAEASAKSKKTKKKISPRQRRRRWLVSVLQPLKGKTLAPGKLTAFQTVMLGRALRSDVVQCAFQYDASQLLEQLLKTAEGFNRHHADQLRKIVQENEAKIREAAESAWWDELVDGAATRLVRSAADQLRRQMLREPVDARIVLAVDAVGPKTAAVAIVTADGRLLHTEDVPCQLSAAMRQQTVTRLGELVHQYHADLIVISNGPARRASLVVLSELLDQSQPGSLRWTLAERSGADLYANGPAGNREMRSTPRRFRAATWLAFQAVSPAQALTKVEPTKLRLGSFQRELADEALAEALGDVIISGVSNDGVDTNGADQTWLARLPGMSEAVAEAIHRRRRKQLFATRTELTELSEWPDEVARNQAIGFLRVFQSEQPLDGTLIHPSDYGLAEKLAKSLEIPLPPEMPPGYQPPAFDQADHGDDEQAAPRAAEGTPASGATTEPKEPATGADGTTENDSIAPAPAKETEGAESGEAASAQTPADAAADQESSQSSTGDAPPATDASEAVETPPTASDQAPADTPAADASAAESAAAANAEDADKGSDGASASDAGDETNDAEKDVTEIKSFRESPARSEGEAEAKPAPPTVPEPYRHPTPDMEKVSRLAKEWQVGPHRARQIVRWLCDPFTSGSSPTIAAPSAVMQRVPKLAELKPGEQVSGVVVGVAPFGVFVELGPDCNGLIHVSKLSESYVEDLHEAVQVGDVLVAWVTGVDSKRRRVALSAVSPEREAELAEQRKQRRDGRRGGGRAGGGQRTGQRAPSGGGRSGPGTGGGGKGAPGGRRRDQPRRDRGRDGKRKDQGPRVYTKVSKSEAAPPPLTEAMQKGDEPLRTFGDLMQFFQQGKQEQKKKPVEPKTPPANQAASEQPASQPPRPAESTGHATPEEQAPPADASAAANEPPKKNVDQGSEPASHDPAVEANRNSETSQDR